MYAISTLFRATNHLVKNPLCARMISSVTKEVILAELRGEFLTLGPEDLKTRLLAEKKFLGQFSTLPHSEAMPERLRRLELRQEVATMLFLDPSLEPNVPSFTAY